MLVHEAAHFPLHNSFTRLYYQYECRWTIIICIIYPAKSIRISECHIIMHIPLYLPSLQLCLHATPRRRTLSTCPFVAHAVQHPECDYHDKRGGSRGHNGDFGRSIPISLGFLFAVSYIRARELCKLTTGRLWLGMFVDR